MAFAMVRSYGYDAATTVSSVPSSESTGALIRREGRRVNLRVAEQVRNDGYMYNATRILKDFVRGRLDARATENGERSDGARAATMAFKSWSKDCGFRAQRGTLTQVFARAISSLVNGGEAYIQRLVDRESVTDIEDLHPNGLFLQAWDGSHVDRSKGEDGHEYNSRGRWVATYFRGVVPDAYSVSWQSVRVDAKDLIEMRLADDVSATQGISFATAAVKAMREIMLADEAGLERARADACLMGVGIARPTSMALNGRYLQAGPTITDIGDGVEVQGVQSGTIAVARGFESIEFTRPTGQNQSPSNRLTRMSAGTGLALQTITGDMSDTNFSASKMAENITERTSMDFSVRSAVEVAKQKLIGWFVGRELQIGHNWTTFNWSFLKRPRRSIDPKVEAQAQETRLKNEVTSRQEEIENEGRDPDEVAAQVAKERENEPDVAQA